jgi:hypothetical protein
MAEPVTILPDGNVITSVALGLLLMRVGYSGVDRNPETLRGTQRGCGLEGFIFNTTVSPLTSLKGMVLSRFLVYSAETQSH